MAASYRLLDPADQAALRRLSVLRNRWSVELAEAMLTGWRTGEPESRGQHQGEAGSDEEDPVPVLDRLMELGLISSRGTGPLRFRLLDVVRDFAIERAAADGELTRSVGGTPWSSPSSPRGSDRISPAGGAARRSGGSTR